jgi:glyceraldehyde-3-phosphate dehydrogenase (ferredoxin)
VPVFKYNEFDVAATSRHNAAIGVQLLDAIIEKRGLLDLSQGARKFARQLSRAKGDKVRDCFVYNAYARKGWMAPNQYWTPGVLSPMAIMGKYYMHYDKNFLPPREVGRFGTRRLRGELIMDNLGCCRFHRSWAEEMLPDIMGSLFDLKKQYLENNHITASRISSRNASIYWESQRNIDYVQTFLIRQHAVEGNNDPQLLKWIDNFAANRKEAALSYWYEMHKGIQESLREF